jgi:heptaprenyl diphosphate synthase
MPIKSRVKTLTSAAIFLALSLIFSYIESFIPIFLLIPIPGFKLGLSNIVIMYMFITSDKYSAAAVSFSRVLIMSVLFGSVTSFFFSLSGAVMSFFMMLISTRFKRSISVFGMSMLCAASHNIGQVLIAYLIFGSLAVFNYLSLLLILSIPTGYITGMLLFVTLKNLPKQKVYNEN